ncbi:hypothetical protein GGS20DRAFT_554187 [Poronia punctata]|nr:hypothetical protein GGS20DRAFT_554187 [Poronia punctata]
MEALQMAQMLADLNDLQAAQDQSAAKNLVSANKALDSQEQPKPQTHHRRSATDGRVSSTPALGRMTDKYGRRIFSPPLSRTNSATPSTPGTPRGDQSLDPDVARASSLLSLYEIRAKLKEQDSSSLMKAREKINALAAKQQQQQQQQQHGQNKPSTTTEHKPSNLSHNRIGSESSKIKYPGRT